INQARQPAEVAVCFAKVDNEIVALFVSCALERGTNDVEDASAWAGGNQSNAPRLCGSRPREADCGQRPDDQGSAFEGTRHCSSCTCCSTYSSQRIAGLDILRPNSDISNSPDKAGQTMMRWPAAQPSCSGHFVALSLARHALSFPRHERPELCIDVPLMKSRGRREDRMPAAPAASCAR